MVDRSDPLFLLARQKIIKLSAELEVQLSDKRGGEPTIEILRRLRDRAAESLMGLVTVNVYTKEGLEQCVSLQNEVKRYDEWLSCMRDILNEGRAYDAEMKATDREEMIDYLSGETDGEQQMRDLGLVEETGAH